MPKADTILSYRDVDPRHVPNYPVASAASYLKVPASTVRTWVYGRDYPVSDGHRTWHPLIKIADRERGLLSFTNLVEVFVLDSVRRRYGIKLPKVRNAIVHLRREFKSEHPLATSRMLTDGYSLFLDSLEDAVVLNISDSPSVAQVGMRDVLIRYLERIQFDPAGAIGVFPFATEAQIDGPAPSARRILIHPRYAYGRPVIAGTDIRTRIVAERKRAGESIEALAEDYCRPLADITDALLYENAA